MDAYYKKAQQGAPTLIRRDFDRALKGG